MRRGPSAAVAAALAAAAFAAAAFAAPASATAPAGGTLVDVAMKAAGGSGPDSNLRDSDLLIQPVLATGLRRR